MNAAALGRVDDLGHVLPGHVEDVGVVVLVEERLDLLGEGLLLGRELEVHGPGGYRESDDPSETRGPVDAGQTEAVASDRRGSGRSCRSCSSSPWGRWPWPGRRGWRRRRCRTARIDAEPEPEAGPATEVVEVAAGTPDQYIAQVDRCEVTDDLVEVAGRLAEHVGGTAGVRRPRRRALRRRQLFDGIDIAVPRSTATTWWVTAAWSSPPTSPAAHRRAYRRPRR